MRAWQVHELGDPIDCMVLGEIDDPDVGPGRVVVDVEAVGLAFPDVLQCRGEYQVKPPLPFTPGSETAGRVSAVGDDVDSAILGRRVVALGGGLAERLVLPASSVFEVPDVLASTKAAAVPMNYGTTWFALHDRAHLAPGETLLVTGAAGGVGSAAIQLGKAAGAGIEEHLHYHVVPRWTGDTNFMPVLGHTKVMVEGLQETWDILKPHFNKLQESV